MSIQVDPFASLLSVASAIIAVWALYVAKHAPLQERTRNHRDNVRTSLSQVLLSLKPLETAISMGHEIPGTSSEIPAAIRAVEEYGNRLPEYKQSLQLLHVQLFGLQSQWESTLRAEENTTREQHHVSKLEEELQTHEREHGQHAYLRDQLSEMRTRAARAQRARDASVNELKEAQTETAAAVRAYISKWNEEDRKSVSR